MNTLLELMTNAPRRTIRPMAMMGLQVSPHFHLLHGSGNYIAANEKHRLILTKIR